MTGIFIIHMPHDQGGVTGITLGKFFDQPGNVLVIGRTVRAIMAA